MALVLASTAVVVTGCGKPDSGGSAAAKPYPRTKCLVTDEGFNHGKPYTFVHQGQEIKLCCEDCLADFKKEPAKYLSKLNATR